MGSDGLVAEHNIQQTVHNKLFIRNLYQIKNFDNEMKKILFILLITACSGSDNNTDDNANTPVDTETPVITLLGDQVVSSFLGDIYEDAGATATDNVDGDITANIIVTGEVNTSSIGTYTLTYNVSDAAGNTATPRTRTINIEEEIFTYVPDDKFEIELIALGYDDVLDDYVSTYNIRSVTQLDLKQLNILDLTGIQDFVALKTLDCSNNLLDTIEATYNLNLKSLNCSHNNLSTIDVSNFTSLEYFNCDSNTISSIDLTQNPSLRQLYCSNNRFNTLDVSSNTALVNLSFYNNFLTEIDLSQNINLETLMCGANKLTALDVSHLTNLTWLFCRVNEFTSLNVANGNNENMVFMHAVSNSDLSCIHIDEGFAPSPVNGWHKDPWAEYSTDCD